MYMQKNCVPRMKIKELAVKEKMEFTTPNKKFAQMNF